MTESAHANVILVAASGFIYAPRGSNNLGDRAQLTCSVERLRAAFPSSRIVAIANSLHDEGGFDDLEVSYSAIRYLTSPILIPVLGFRLPAGAARVLRILLLLANCRRAANRRSPLLLSPAGRRALRELVEADALFFSGAGTFNDLYIVGVGGFWGVLARCMSLLKKPIVASGQQIGPLTRLTRRTLVRWAVRPIDLLGVRDPLSMECASRVGVPERRILLTGDDAWGLTPARSSAARAVLSRHGITEPFLAAQMRFGGSVGWDEADAPKVACALNGLCTELELPVLFVACHVGLGADDRAAAALVREHINCVSWALDEELDARTTKALLARASLGVGIANHFCVFAASMGTPVVGLYGSPYMKQKIIGLARLWPSRVAALPKESGLRSPELVDAARHLLERRSVGNGDTLRDRSAIQTHPDSPIRMLARLLEERGACT